MSEENRALVVMYHYVRESRELSSDGIRPLLKSEFEEQLDWLEDNFRIVSPQEFLLAVKNGLKPAGKAPCLLTFDDGTRDHLEIVAPVLLRRSLSGVFFTLTWPSEYQRMPVAHALHWILGHPEDEVWTTLKDFAETNLGGIGALGSAEDAAKVYYYEPRLRAQIKYAVNFVLPPDAAEGFVSEFADACGTRLTDLACEWFLSEQDIRQLDAYGMEIGIHGSSHLSLTQLGAVNMGHEITHSSHYLRGLLGKPPAWFSYPFGGSGLKEDKDLIHQQCRRLKIEGIATTRRGFMTAQTSLYEIPRYDCINLPPKSNLITDDQHQSK